MSCPYGAYLVNSGCQNCSLQNCISCDTIGPNICTLCNIGYYLANNFCNSCLANCAICTNGQTCQSCLSGFYLNPVNNTCSACSSHCGICSSSTNCSQCISGYYAKLGLCYQCPA